MSAISCSPPYSETAQDQARPDTVRFNVGGRIFSVSLSTMLFHPDSLLTKMVKYDVGMEENGSEGEDWPHVAGAQCRLRKRTASDIKRPSSPLIIDRDPDQFAIVLDYLRTSRLAIPSDKSVSLHALQHDAEYYNLPGLAALISSYSRPPFALYSVSRTGESWGSASMCCLRLALPGKNSLRAIVGSRPFEDLKRFTNKSLQLVEEACERENKKEEDVGSGFSWSIAGVQLGQDPRALFLVYLQRSDSMAEEDRVYRNPPVTPSVQVKQKKVHMLSCVAYMATTGIIAAIWLVFRTLFAARDNHR